MGRCKIGLGRFSRARREFFGGLQSKNVIRITAHHPQLAKGGTNTETIPVKRKDKKKNRKRKESPLHVGDTQGNATNLKYGGKDAETALTQTGVTNH